MIGPATRECKNETDRSSREQAGWCPEGEWSLRAAGALECGTGGAQQRQRAQGLYETRQSGEGCIFHVLNAQQHRESCWCPRRGSPANSGAWWSPAACKECSARLPSCQWHRSLEFCTCRASQPHLKLTGARGHHLVWSAHERQPCGALLAQPAGRHRHHRCQAKPSASTDLHDQPMTI